MSEAAVHTPTSVRSRPNGRGRLLVDIAVALLRGGLGVDFVAHGSQKLFGAFGGIGLSGSGKFFDSLGAHPGYFWAVVAGLIEFGGGVCMLLGLFVRLASIGIAADMLMAIAIYNAPHGFFTETPTDGWEINFLIICMAFAVTLLGPGRFALATPLRGDGSVPLRRTLAAL